MTLSLFRCALVAASLATPAAAFDPAAMTAQEKTAFGEAVRSWLLDNPEILIEMSQSLEQKQFAEQVADDKTMLADNHDAIFNDGYSWVGGNPEGDVTLVEFLDYRCGYCRKSQGEVEDLVASDGNIRLVIKEFPILGDASLASSRFAIAVHQLGGDEVYKKAHDSLIALRGEPDAATLSRLAGTLGLDPAAIARRMESAEVAKVIADNHTLGQTLDIQGTPTFVIANTMVRGYVPLDSMRQIVAGVRK